MKNQRLFILLLLITVVSGWGVAETGSTKQLSEVTVRVGNLAVQQVPVEVFKKQKGLTAISSSGKYRVTHYQYLRSYDPQGKAKGNNTAISGAFRVWGADFSQEVLDDLSNAQFTDMIYIDEILVISPEGDTLKMPTLQYRLI